MWNVCTHLYGVRTLKNGVMCDYWYDVCVFLSVVYLKGKAVCDHEFVLVYIICLYIHHHIYMGELGRLFHSPSVPNNDGRFFLWQICVPV